MLLLRAFSRLVALLLLVALALTGLAAAVFSIETGRRGLSIPGLAHTAHLPQLRHSVGHHLRQLEHPGGPAWRSLLFGLGVVAAGLLLVATALWPRGDRDLTLEQSDIGRLSARRRALRQAAASAAEQADGIAGARVRIRRRPRARMLVKASRPAAVPADEAEAAIGDQLAAIAQGFELHPRIRTRPAGER